MQCPTCFKMRPKAMWRPSQWYSWSPVTNDFHQCKYCDGERKINYGWGHPAQANDAPAQATQHKPQDAPAQATHHDAPAQATQHDAPAHPPKMRPMPPFDLNIPEEVLWLVEASMALDTDKFGKFVSMWMTLPHQARKWTSPPILTSLSNIPQQAPKWT